MTTSQLSAAALAILSAFATALAADPVVSNLTAAQRPGTKLVDITYDVTADTPTVRVTLEISSDGGATYNLPVTAVSGAVGDSVALGTGRTITWNAEVDWNENFTPQTRFRVVADDLLPTVIAILGVDSNKNFSIGRTEVTWAEFQAVRRWAEENGYDIGDAGAGIAPNHPATTVNWYEILKWCNAASERTGLRPAYKVGTSIYRTGNIVPTIDSTSDGYRLPSVTEWVFAARGGVKTNGYVYSGSNDIRALRKIPCEAS